MWGLIARRLVALPLTLLGILALTFLILPLAMANPEVGRSKMADEQQQQEFILRANLHRSLPAQFVLFLSELASGSLGDSWETGRPLSAELVDRVPATIELATAATVLAVVAGVGAGVLAALYRGRWPDVAVMIAALAGLSVPIFCLAIFAKELVALNVAFLPTSARQGLASLIRYEPRTHFVLLDALWAGDGAAFGDALAHLALPALCLATVPVAVIARITRAAMLDALGQEYVRTARAKGLPWPRVVLRHALKNALLPVLTVAGAEFGALLGGAVLTETVFDWPGMGQYIVRAVESNDYQKIRVGVLMLTVSYVLVNLLTDVLYIVVNPRLRKA